MTWWQKYVTTSLPARTALHCTTFNWCFCAFCSWITSWILFHILLKERLPMVFLWMETAEPGIWSEYFHNWFILLGHSQLKMHWIYNWPEKKSYMLSVKVSNTLEIRRLRSTESSNLQAEGQTLSLYFCTPATSDCSLPSTSCFGNAPFSHLPLQAKHLCSAML